ncbi:hemolysin-3 like protein [Flavobacteriaceae bacterium UJ101]|nr:hemolysin-3 like protein [Flavobacteriaceae bacterium UJ101]
MEAIFYSKKEEIANAITHGIGIILSIIGLVYMLVYSIQNGDISHITGSIIFGSTLIIMYTCSTLYHTFQTEKRKVFFRKLDHIAIYLLIAGSYTPFTLITLKDTAWGWSIFGIIWALALFGIIYKLTPLNRYKKLSLILYLGMGWLVVLAAKPMIESLDTNGLWLLIIGGLTYTLGVIFYVWEKLPFNHAIWHVFVLGGSICHFFAVFWYVIP